MTAPEPPIPTDAEIVEGALGPPDFGRELVWASLCAHRRDPEGEPASWSMHPTARLVGQYVFMSNEHGATSALSAVREAVLEALQLVRDMRAIDAAALRQPLGEVNLFLDVLTAAGIVLTPVVDYPVTDEQLGLSELTAVAFDPDDDDCGGWRRSVRDGAN